MKRSKQKLTFSMYAAIKLSLNNSTREADILSHACGRMSASLASLPLVSFNPTVHNVSINSEDSKFYEAFQNCVKKGMQYSAFSIRLNNESTITSKKIPMLIGKIHLDTATL
jgi:hypothetical protein